MEENVKSKQHNENLDLLKLIACIAVVGLHTLIPYALLLYYLCGFAVPVFLMVSGYVLINKIDITWDYVKHKVSTILRIVIAWNIIRWFVSLSGILLGKDILNYSIMYLIKQAVESLIQKGKMWQFWYFGTLVIIYLLLPLIHSIFFKNCCKNCNVPLAGILWGSLVLISVAIQACSMIYGKALQQNVIQTFRLWSWLQYFILGGILLKISPLIYSKISVKLYLFLLCSSSILIIFYQYVVGKYTLKIMYAEYFYDSIFMIAWITILFTWIMRIRLSEMQGLHISNLCSLTLGVYIIHPMILLIIEKIIPKCSCVTAVENFLIVVVISFAVVYAMSKVQIIKKYLLTM